MMEDPIDPNPSPTNIELVIENQQSNQTVENDISSAIWSEESYPIQSHSETVPSTTDNHIRQQSSILNRWCKSTRRKIILFGLITLLVIVIIIVVVIKFTVSNSSQTTYESSMSVTNLYSGTTITTAKTPIIYDVGGGGVSGGPPCSSHTVINDPTRNIAASGIGGTCDTGVFFNTSIGGRWIRFMGTGGTMIPLRSPGINHCGAFLAGWFNGTLPSTIGTIADAYVRFELDPSINDYLVSVSIVNCGSFYAYFLRPVVLCNARYCTV